MGTKIKARFGKAMKDPWIVMAFVLGLAALGVLADRYGFDLSIDVAAESESEGESERAE